MKAYASPDNVGVVDLRARQHSELRGDRLITGELCGEFIDLRDLSLELQGKVEELRDVHADLLLRPPEPGRPIIEKILRNRRR